MHLHYLLTEQVDSCGSRIEGAKVRQALKSLLNKENLVTVVVDFAGVSVCSSGFADEAFGKLFVELGDDEFTEKIQFANLSEFNFQIIDAAMLQRERGY